ncbi:MAG: MarR family transcriptional regulator [Deltaproteobacteria bacterium]|nr:MarR family transcriptional regulator [Deltaproteobacteria bacterium]
MGSHTIVPRRRPAQSRLLSRSRPHIESAAPPPGDARVALDAIRHLVQALRQSGLDAQRQVGLSGAQLFVLHQLDGQPPLSVNQLAERTLTHQSSVSVVVQRLADQGLVQKLKSPRDGRQVALTLTPKARALLRRAPDPVQKRLFSALDRLSPARRRSLAHALTALVAELGVSGAPRMFFEDDRHV